MANDDPVAHMAARLNGGGTRRSSAGGAAHKRGAQGDSDVPGFDEALGQLEATVAALEGGQLTLEEALSLFERGMHLAQICQQALDRAELRVRQLVVAENEAGEMTIETLDLDVE